MAARLSVGLLLLVCLTTCLARPVIASRGAYYEMTTGISKIELQADTPYVELQYLHFRAEIDNETPFYWFWVGSAENAGYRDGSLNATTVSENGKTDLFQVISISLYWEEPT